MQHGLVRAESRRRPTVTTGVQQLLHGQPELQGPDERVKQREHHHRRQLSIGSAHERVHRVHRDVQQLPRWAVRVDDPDLVVSVLVGCVPRDVQPNQQRHLEEDVRGSSRRSPPRKNAATRCDHHRDLLDATYLRSRKYQQRFVSEYVGLVDRAPAMSSQCPGWPHAAPVTAIVTPHRPPWQQLLFSTATCAPGMEYPRCEVFPAGDGAGWPLLVTRRRHHDGSRRLPSERHRLHFVDAVPLPCVCEPVRRREWLLVGSLGRTIGYHSVWGATKDAMRRLLHVSQGFGSYRLRGPIRMPGILGAGVDRLPVRRRVPLGVADGETTTADRVEQHHHDSGTHFVIHASSLLDQLGDLLPDFVERVHLDGEPHSPRFCVRWPSRHVLSCPLGSRAASFH